MLMEMVMESLFAIVDTYFVSKLGTLALATVGLTESLLSIVYSLAMGLSMAATAIVARRVGEKNYTAAAKTSAQTIVLTIILSLSIAIVGLLFAKQLLSALGASAQVIQYGSNYTYIALGGNIVIVMLFVLNGIFRGAGNAGIAFRSLLIANGINIICCPIFINYYGITGAALATLVGRTCGVIYQIYNLTQSNNLFTILKSYYKPHKATIINILNIAWSASLQFIIASGSWIFLSKLIANFGDSAIAGYTIAIRILLFFIMPAWGISNAAATLVGQNLGAMQYLRAEACVWQTAKVNALFMALVTLTSLLFGSSIVQFFTHNSSLVIVATQAMHILSIGYIVYGIGMVVLNAFNGASDSRTPSLINFLGYWCLQIPLAWFIATQTKYGMAGVFYAIVITEFLVTLTGCYLFKQGKWKQKKI